MEVIPKDNQKMTQSGSQTGNSSFTVVVSPSGRNFSVDQGETILAAAIRQGVGLAYGCKDGACGSCKCHLLRGEVEHGAHQEKALSAAEAAQGMVLTCCAQARTDLMIESRNVTQTDSAQIRMMPSRVSEMERKLADVMILRLQLPASETLDYHPGQYLDFLLRDGSRRSYSMANAPHLGPGVELHIRHMPGGRFTDHVFGAMKTKEILRLEGPFGSFYLREDSTKPIILLASGTGFAPIKAILEHLQHLGSQRSATLYWGGRRAADLYLDDWVRRQLVSMQHLRYVPVVSDALDEDAWQGRTGFVHRAVLEDFPDLSEHQVYACGAPVMVDAAHRDFVRLAGLPDDAFFADAFTSQADKISLAA
jgi:CDP-4-dehydro-6-deoxyglucose reductase